MSTDYLSNPFRPYLRMSLPNQRRRSRAAAARRRINSNTVVEFQAITDPENLLRVFRLLKSTGGQAPGIDRIRYRDLSTGEIASALRSVSRAIRAHRYCPYPTRSVWIAKANGGHRELRIGSICDRVVAAAVHEALSPTIERVLLPGCHGFRQGHSVLGMLASLERAMVDNNRYVIVTDDVQNAFPSIVIEDAMADYRGLVGDPDILWLIETLLRGHDGMLRYVGIDQGSPLSPMTMNLRLSNCLDGPFTASPGNPLLLRWADNIVLPCSSVSDANEAVQHAAELLLAAGLRLKGNEGSPTNLRRQGAQKKILGYHISFRNGGLRLTVPRNAWERLRKELSHAHATRRPRKLAVTMIRGWLDVYGVAYGGVEVHETAVRLMAMAAELGFRDVGYRSGVEHCIRESRRRWELARWNAVFRL